MLELTGYSVGLAFTCEDQRNDHVGRRNVAYFMRRELSHLFRKTKSVSTNALFTAITGCTAL